MRKIFFTPFILLLLTTGCVVKNGQNEQKSPTQLAQIDEAEYDKYFTGETMRFDFQHSGNSSEEFYSYERMKREGEWAGSRKSLINPFGYGEQLFRIIDTEENKLIYQNNYCTLFNEWQTTAEAQTTRRSYPEALIFPCPKRNFTIEIYARNKVSKVFEKKFSYNANINDYNIEPYKRKYESVDIHIGGTVANSLDIVLLPDGFTTEEKEKFLEACKAWHDALFGYAPFTGNKHRINIRAVWASSEESGISVPGKGEWKKTLLDCRFYTLGSERYQMTDNLQKVRDVAADAPYESIFILTNSDKYGGGGIYNFYGLGSAGKTGKTGEVYVHEFGHSLMGLGDEYVEKGNTVSALYPADKEPWEANLTTFVNFNGKWEQMIDKKTAIPTIANDSLLALPDTEWPVGAYEGGGYLEKGIYRPWPKCMMNQLYNFCPVCCAAIEKYLDYICK
ncbi:MAG: peptidase M64 [Bacteroidaceae bacterium]|nr:peptidase M64 [Bacteroidaceae bacterium]